MTKRRMTNFISIRKLFGITENNGFSVEEINTFIKQSNVLPKVLYNYYLELGKITKLNQIQDKLLLPNQIDYSGNQDLSLIHI